MSEHDDDLRLRNAVHAAYDGIQTSPRFTERVLLSLRSRERRPSRTPHLVVGLAVGSILAVVLGVSTVTGRLGGSHAAPAALAPPATTPSPSASTAPTDAPTATAGVATSTPAATAAPPPATIPTAHPTPPPIPSTPAWRENPALATGPGLPVVMYGGGYCGAEVFDTHWWDGRHWYTQTQAAGPRLGTPALGWDPLTGQLLLVGLYEGCGSEHTNRAMQTWGWRPASNGQGGTWHLLDVMHEPTGGGNTGSSLAYDPSSRRTLLMLHFLGVDNSSYALWSWDGHGWSQSWSTACSAPAPPWPPCALGPPAIIDGPHGTVIGLSTDSQNNPEVVRWTGSGWSVEQAEGTPPPQWVGGLAYDGLSDRTLAITYSSSSPGALYVFDGSGWTSSPIPGDLKARQGFGFTAFNGSGLSALFWGGENPNTNTPTTYDDTWTYSEGTWRKVGA